MNERSVIGQPESGPRAGWVDVYMPEGRMVPASPAPQFINFDFIRGILYRQRWLIAGVITAALVAGVIWTLLATPVYQAEATVRIIPSGGDIVEGQDVGETFASNQLSAYIATQMEVIASKSTAEKIARERNLGTRYDLLGKDIDESRPDNLTDKAWLQQKERIAAQRLANSISTEKPVGNWIVSIKFRSSNPAIAAEFANAYADAAVALNTSRSIEDNRFAVEFLRTEIATTRERLREAEQAANLYARNEGIIVEQPTENAAGTGGTLITSNLASFNQRLADARSARIAAEQKWRAVANLPPSQLAEVQASNLLQSLASTLSAKRLEVAELRQRYSDDFPPVVNLLSQIAILEQQIQRSGAEVKTTLRNDYTIALSQEQALERELNSITGQALLEQDMRVQFGSLERDAQALREQLNVLLTRYNQLSSAANISSSNIAKLDSASVPVRPVAPNPMRNMTLALIFGLAVAAGLSVLRETLDDRVRSLDDVENKVGLTLLGHTPYLGEREIDIQGSDRFSALMEAYSSIRAAIDFSLSRSQNVVLLTSCNASEGKSTTSVVLAELFSALGRRTLLIDADVRRPSVARLLDRERPKAGLAEVVLGHVELEEALLKGVHQNLDILPVGEIPPNPTDLISSPDFAKFIDRCRNEYSLVIIDTAPVLGLADAPILSRLVDATILVLEANRVPFGQVRAVTKRLNMAGANLLGVVLTKYRALDAGQSYNYQYGYYTYGEKPE